MKLIYVHHANRKKGNPPSQNDGITEVGLKDCEVVRELLSLVNQKEKITKIYTSQFFRCTKTVDIINENVKASVIIDNRLDEVGSVLGETWLDAQKRIKECIDEIVAKSNPTDVVVCVTSGINLGVFVAKAFNVPLSENLPMLGVPSCSPIVFEF